MPRLLSLCCALAALALAPACVPHHHHASRAPAPVVAKRGGPPPHAPAHGYRHKHATTDVDLVFDSGLGVYAVVGWDGHYFSHGHFYRWHRGDWQISTRLRGGWALVHVDKVPRRLAKKRHRAKHHKHRHGHGKHPAKHAH